MANIRQFENIKRIVVKVGTSSLTHPNGKVNLQAIDQLSYTLSGLVNEGKQVVLVSSGAIGVGMGQLNLQERPTDIPEQQALAALGQSLLMTIYQQRFATYGQKISQVLLTHDVLDYPQSKANVNNAINKMLDWGIIPVVNENDTVATDELDHKTKFGDNDQLSAIVAAIIDADMLIMLSDIEGFFDKNPKKYEDAKLIPEINEINDQTYQHASGKGSKFGTGGMTTKLKAAQRMMKNDKLTVLASGANPSIIFRILNGEAIGTLFRKD